MGGCIFCRIVRREIPAQIDQESSQTLAFHDIHPQAPLHVLIVPKEHLSSILDLEKRHSEVLGEMVAVAQKIACREGVDQSGFRLVFNCGPDAGQAVDHLHLHLLAKRKLAWPPG
ncbi:MAG: histidine triad nucleotide-binding protein [Elusimicrobia bacterium]|nr:histidine triad nucleotide-binding protein [Elusimicrobiota bacterium]MBI4217754.1 histidine triad nucleotide-binding protein [Elusimicrobiota bacterium]